MADEALCFDMYGTLCDTSSVTETLGEELGVTARFADQVDRLWRQKQLTYSFQLNAMGSYRPFRDVTAEALRYALAYYDLYPDEHVQEHILDAYDELSPFPDAVDALAALGEDYTVAVLSNGNPGMLEPLAAHAGFTPHLDDVVSADEVSVFKPDPAVYQNAADRLDTPLSECYLVSSNAWDVAGASHAGMRTAWVNRYREPMDRVGGEPDVEVRSLGDLADVL